MCVKSHRHLCLQIFLLIILVICLFLFSTIILANVGFYLLTSSASLIQEGGVTPSASEPVAVSVPPTEDVSSPPVALSSDQITLTDPGTNLTVSAPQALVSGGDDDDDDDDDGLQLADWLVSKVTLSSNCSWFNSTVQTGQLLQLCAEFPDSFSSNRAFVQCFRTTLLYKGLASLLPALLIFLSILAVCRLLLCPLLTLALVYLLLAIGLVVGAILFDSGVIIDNLQTEDTLPAVFHCLLFLVILYIVFAILHLLLFGLVTCEKRRMRQNGDSEKIMKQSTDDEDDIDDPNAPLYENGYSPQKKSDFEDKIKEFKFIDDDMSYIFRKG